MTKSMRAFGSIAVALALAVPVTAWAQAGPRNGGSTSSGSSSSGGSSAGRQLSGGNSGGGGSEGSRVSPPSGANGAPMSSILGSPSRIPRTSSSPSRTASVSEATRVAPPPGGVADVEVEIDASTARVTGVQPAGSPRQVVPSLTPQRARLRGGWQRRPGHAGPRPLPVIPGGDFVSFPFYGPWGGWYPWCYSGFGWGLGFVYYDPWFYGPTSWYWGRYGMWYDPYAYFGDPYVSVGRRILVVV